MLVNLWAGPLADVEQSSVDVILGATSVEIRSCSHEKFTVRRSTGLMACSEWHWTQRWITKNLNSEYVWEATGALKSPFIMWSLKWSCHLKATIL